MTRWGELYEQHCAIRSVSMELATALRRRLVKLVDRGHCAPTIQGRFTRRERGALRELYIQPIDERDQREPLLALPLLENARLTVLALLSRRADHLHQFSAMVEGTTPTGTTWAAAVHLEDDLNPDEQDRKGGGAWGPAACPCQVGPTLDHEPKVRVPLPAIGPADALDWLLTIVVPGWEPAPWADVVAGRTTNRSR
jgi:hypothetical protein